jgi:hypothetical protein
MTTLVNLFNGIIAVSITFPISTGNGTRLSTLIAAGTLLTPSADLPNWLTATTSANFQSTTVDNGGGIAGSSPLTRWIAQRCAQVVIEDHASTFQTDFLPGMTGPLVSRVSGTAFQSVAALDGVKRTYARAAAAAFSAVALCLLMPAPVDTP